MKLYTVQFEFILHCFFYEVKLIFVFKIVMIISQHKLFQAISTMMKVPATLVVCFWLILCEYGNHCIPMYTPE